MQRVKPLSSHINPPRSNWREQADIGVIKLHNICSSSCGSCSKTFPLVTNSNVGFFLQSVLGSNRFRVIWSQYLKTMKQECWALLNYPAPMGWRRLGVELKSGDPCMCVTLIQNASNDEGVCRHPETGGYHTLVCNTSRKRLKFI